MSRPFLVYCPTSGRGISAELWGENRKFDVALNNYLGEDLGLERAEHAFRIAGHKWQSIYQAIPALAEQYSAFAFLDDDIEASTEQINALFEIGQTEGLQLWQAALTPDSYWSHYRFVCIPGNTVRATPFVEVMMPFFSQSALAVCLPTFAESQSGWGLDLVWPALLGREGLAVVDGVALRHSRPIQSLNWTMPNGLTPFQEVEKLLSKYPKAWGQAYRGPTRFHYGKTRTQGPGTQ